ncbi:hypothetical protein Y032_0012g1821 [Ancylostoma ceylanicum]|uniref:Uncharacterized protein n=1 Tax=Ancylostoma ceylanicum TaxID=53326 RepID=A0A016VD09_9BILA|nr:hypothetical protein Y032_0012g1821 [Ancylostoma ceylanicum]
MASANSVLADVDSFLQEIANSSVSPSHEHHAPPHHHVKVFVELIASRLILFFFSSLAFIFMVSGMGKRLGIADNLLCNVPR